MTQATDLEPIEYLYRPMYRNPTFAAMPAGLKWDFVEAPATDPMIAVRRGLPLSRHPFGIIATDRRLTEIERRDYELEIA